MDHEPVQPAWVVPAALVVATAIGQLLTVAPWTDTFLAQIAWWPGAILMCGLLVSRKQHWALCCAGALLGSALVCASMGRDLLPYCVRLAGEFALVAVATMALQPRRTVLHLQVPGHDARECNPARFVVIAGIVLPVLGAAWCVAASRQFGIPSPREDWVQMALGRSLAYLLLVPTFVALVRLTHGRVPATGRVPSLLAALGVFALVGAWMSALGRGEVAPLLLVAPIVLLIWTNHAIGGAWSWIVWSIACTACLWLSTLGTGPLVHESERATVTHLQWWAIGTSVVLLLLTTLREQRGIARDALRDSYERLGQLARRVMTMQENERSRIARDLHDDVSQSLASLSIELSGLKRHADASSRERIEAMQEHLLGVSDDIRRLSHELHPSMLRYTSLAASLEALCASHSRDELEVHCETEETFSLSEQQKLELFRIAQEALHNAEKHADASRVHIALRREGDGALLRIEDDGCGLPEDYASARHAGLGMISMAERVKTLRGQLQFASAAQGGTCVEVRFPVGGPVR